jgi:hypothetical protein
MVDRREGCMDGSLICVVSVDIDREVEDAFNVWYDRHIEEVIRCPGWVRATRYRCLDGEPRYLAVYDVEDRASAAVGSVSNWTPEIQRLQQAGYEEFWPHIEGYRARTYERISQLPPARTPSERHSGPRDRPKVRPPSRF